MGAWRALTGTKSGQCVHSGAGQVSNWMVICGRLVNQKVGSHHGMMRSLPALVRLHLLRKPIHS